MAIGLCPPPHFHSESATVGGSRCSVVPVPPLRRDELVDNAPGELRVQVVEDALQVAAPQVPQLRLVEEPEGLQHAQERVRTGAAGARGPFI